MMFVDRISKKTPFIEMQLRLWWMNALAVGLTPKHDGKSSLVLGADC